MTPAPVMFSGSVRLDGDHVLVTVGGDIDVENLSMFTDLMAQAVSFHARSVTVDLACLTFLDSQALHVLVSSAEQVRVWGAKLDVRAAPPRIYEVLKMAGLLGSLHVAAPAPASLAPAVAAMVAALSTFPRTRGVLDAALNLIVEMAQAVVVGADGASITLPRYGTLGTAAASNDTVLQMDHDQYDTREGPCLDAALEGHRFHIDTLSSETRWPAFVPRAQARGINSILSTPVTVRGAPFGALNIYSRQAGVFTAQDNHWANTFADQTSLIVTAAGDPTSPGLQDQVTHALEARDLINLAQGIVMHRDGVPSETAYVTLRDLSRTTDTSMRDLAEQVVALHRDPSPTTGSQDTTHGRQNQQ